MSVVTPCVEMDEALTNWEKRRRNGSTKEGKKKFGEDLGGRRGRRQETRREREEGEKGEVRGSDRHNTSSESVPSPALVVEGGAEINPSFIGTPASVSSFPKHSLSDTFITNPQSQSRNRKKEKQTRTTGETEVRAHGVVSYAKLSDSLSETDAWLGTLNVIT